MQTRDAMGNHIKEVDATLGNKPDRKAYGYLCLVPQHNQVMNLQNDFNKLDSRYKKFLKTGIIKSFHTCRSKWMKWPNALAPYTENVAYALAWTCFSKASLFLREILHSLLSAFLPAADISAFDGVKNVLLVDASVIRQNGKQQYQQRIHLCYSLNENRMKQVKVSDQHTAESLTHF